VVQVGLMNVDGYFDTLLAFFDKALDEGFLNLASRQIVVSASTASDLLSKMEVL
jgi:predicted Rossmann-fold nucleotide-binding protein